jgi:hypothetical protein
VGGRGTEVLIRKAQEQVGSHVCDLSLRKYVDTPSSFPLFEESRHLGTVVLDSPTVPA